MRTKTRTAVNIVVVAVLLVSVITHAGRTHAEPQVIRYTYDAADRLVSAVYDIESAVFYEYDESGNRVRKTVVGPGDKRADHDGNDLFDLWELRYYGSLYSDPDANPDYDPVGNYAESKSWTDPFDGESYLRLLAAELGGASNEFFVVRWASATNAVYGIHKGTNLVHGSWSPLAGALPATPPENAYTDTVNSVSAAFYRVETE